MKDIEKIRDAQLKVKDAILADYPIEMIESRVKEMFEVYEKEDGKYVRTFDELQLGLDLQETGMLLSFIKGRIDEVLYNLDDYGSQVDGFQDLAFLSEDQKAKIGQRIFHFASRIIDYCRLKYVRKTYDRTPKCKCLLCRKSEAVNTNSHIVPRFIVQRFFNLDGSGTRDTEAVDSWSLQDGESYHNFGTDASAQVFEKVLGHEVLQAEIDEYTKNRTLSRDYVFCKRCEDRFGAIESMYSQILQNPAKEYEHAIPYLFWMSVVWRMSAVGIGIKMTAQHEEKLRKILDDALSTNKGDIVTDYRKLGHCAYAIAKADDTRDETLGVFGHHQPMMPYVFMIGNMVFNFYPTVNKARSAFKHKGRDLSLINDGTKREVISDLSFLEFWLAKRTIIDTNGKFHSQWNQPYNIVDYTASMTKADRDTLTEDCALTFDMLPPPMPGYWKISIPRSIQKIQRVIEHQPQATPGDIQQATGYTAEESAAMLSYARQNILPLRAD